MKKITKTNKMESETIIVLSEDDSKTISDLAAINTDITSIARSLNINPDDFEAQYLIDGSPINRAVEAGINSADKSIKEVQFEAAKSGDKASISAFKKDAINARWQRHKQKLLFDRKLGDYENLRMAIENGKGEIPDHLKQYYKVLDFGRSLYSQMNSRSFIINMVRTKWTDISYSLANKLYYESLNFFYCDNKVKKSTWANIYADQLDTIASLALERGQLDIAGKYKVEAARLRGVGRDEPAQVPPELLDRRPVLYTFSFSDIGLQPANRRELGSMIDSLDVSESQKLRLKNDARIENVEFELFPNTADAEE